MNSVQTLLDRLDGVRAARDGRWMAKCPAHEDSNPSLSIMDRGGKVLVHCFGGCSSLDVVGAVGLSLGDLFADPPTASRGIRAGGVHVHAKDLLAMLEYESQVVALAAGDIAAGKPLSGVDADRIATAHERLRRARAIFVGDA